MKWFISGLGEGIFAPIVQVCVAIFLTSLVEMQQIVEQVGPNSVNEPIFSLGFFLFIIAIMTFAENIITGLFNKESWTIGYFIGAFFGLSIYGKYLYSVLPEANYTMIGTLLIIFAGFILRLWLNLKQSGYNSGYHSMW